MNSHAQFSKNNAFRSLLLPGALFLSIAASAFAQLPIQESCPDMIQTHIDWLNKGLLGTSETALIYAAVAGTTSSHQLPNNTTSSVADPVQFSTGTILSLDAKRNLVFLGNLQVSPAFAVNQALTMRVTVTRNGDVTVERLLNNVPFPLHAPDTFTATCTGNVLTGYANGIQYTIGLQNTTSSDPGV